jgi:predicted transcriptional regulator of viral defense system
MSTHRRSLAELLDDLQAEGRYTLDRDEAMRQLGTSRSAFYWAAKRLREKGRLVVLKGRFLVIVPTEYRSAKAPPPSWYVHDFMKFSEREYYAGLLSAAAIHGAAHQRPQEFQVVVDRHLAPLRVGRSVVRFVQKAQCASTPVVVVNTETGYMNVSTPEATALDLVRYARQSAGLGNVATVLAELAEKIDSARLAAAAGLGAELSCAQRLGYLLAHLRREHLVADLARWLRSRKPRIVPLAPWLPAEGAPVDRGWKVRVNAPIEADL